jgi:hypothetical protein
MYLFISTFSLNIVNPLSKDKEKSKTGIIHQVAFIPIFGPVDETGVADRENADSNQTKSSEAMHWKQNEKKRRERERERDVPIVDQGDERESD